MSQASKSHPEDALGGHSKASQKRDSSQPGTTSDCDEALGGVNKVRPKHAHEGHANTHQKQEGDGVHNGVPTEKNRSQETVKLASAGRTQQALKAGPYGSVTHADGSKQSEKNPHKPTSGI